MNIRRFKVLHEAGASYAEIAREVGCDWRTVRRYLAEDAPPYPPRGTSRAGTQPRAITDEVAALIEDMLRADVDLPVSVIHERLASDHAVTVNHQRVKIYRTHGQVIGERAVADHAALTPCPAQPYLVADTHLRRVGRDCLVSFESSRYSVLPNRFTEDSMCRSSLVWTGSRSAPSIPRALTCSRCIPDQPFAEPGSSMTSIGAVYLTGTHPLHDHGHRKPRRGNDTPGRSSPRLIGGSRLRGAARDDYKTRVCADANGPVTPTGAVEMEFEHRDPAVEFILGDHV